MVKTLVDVVTGLEAVLGNGLIDYANNNGEMIMTYSDCVIRMKDEKNKPSMSASIYPINLKGLSQANAIIEKLNRVIAPVMQIRIDRICIVKEDGHVTSFYIKDSKFAGMTEGEKE